MKLIIFLGLLFQTGIGFSYEISPFNLATRAYQGAYENVQLESGKSIGGAAIFRLNVALDRKEVAQALMQEAMLEKRLPNFKEADQKAYQRHLEWSLEDVCDKD